MITADYIVVGSGLTGSTIARILRDSGRDVLVIERRNHIGGNVHETIHESGITFHTYGPHYFRTNSDRIWSFVNRFDTFLPFEACLLTFVEGRFERWPVHAEYMRRTLGNQWYPGFFGVPSNFEEAALSMMPRLVYDKFVKGYTEKQWGVSASSLDVSLAGRFTVRDDNDFRLSRHVYQGIPGKGYTAWMKELLADIPVLIGVEYTKNASSIRAKKLLVHTGPIDELFGFEFGRLRYRGQRRTTRFVAGTIYAQPGIQVNYPDLSDGEKVRTIEWKHLPSCSNKVFEGTLLTDETPYDPQDSDSYEYPFPDELNRDLYKRYAQLAALDSKLLVCGRLGEYRYLDMDQAIGRAMVLADRIVK